MNRLKPSHFTLSEETKPLFGSITRLHKNRLKHIMDSTLPGAETTSSDAIIAQKIEQEKEAEKIVFELRDRCVRPHRHNPTNSELNSALKALRVLFLLLPPFERQPWEINRTFFLRTLDEVWKYRKIDMFFTED